MERKRGTAPGKQDAGVRGRKSQPVTGPEPGRTADDDVASAALRRRNGADSALPGQVDRPAATLALQRLAGNRAVNTLVQRDDPAPAAAATPPVAAPTLDRGVLVRTGERVVQDYRQAAGEALQMAEHRLPSSPAGSIASNGLWLATTLPGKIKEPGFLAAISFASDLHGRATASSMDKNDFIQACQDQINRFYRELSQQIDPTVTRLVAAAREHDAGTDRARYVLVRYLVGGNRRFVMRSGPAVHVNIAALSAAIESQLLMRAATTPHTNWAGWRFDDVTMDFHYRLTGVGDPQAPPRYRPHANPVADWDTPELTSVRLMGQTSVSGLAARLNHLHRTQLGPMVTRTMPFRKRVMVSLSRGGRGGGWGMVYVTTSPAGQPQRVEPFFIDEAKRTALEEVLGGGLGRLAAVAWRGSGGRPPTIDQIDT